MSDIVDKYERIINLNRKKLSTIKEKSKISGLAIAVVTMDKPIWIESFGFTDLSKKYKINGDTLFSLQSTTKTYTSIAFLLAMQKGLVKLDEPIVNYYPEFYINCREGTEEYKKITFHHLLTHTSGLPRESRKGGCFSHNTPSWEEHIKSLSDSWMNNPAGTRFDYSNIGMDLVAYILERIVKKPYYNYLQEVLGNPLGITFHWFMDEIYSLPNSVKGYLSEYPTHMLDEVAFGCGGIFLSINHQAKFVQFLLNKGTFNNKVLLKRNYFELLRTIDGELGYGLGTEVSNQFGTQIQNHAGSGFGFGSEMFWIPEQNLGFALLYNDENQSWIMRQFMEELIELFLRVKSVVPKKNPFPYDNKPIITLEKERLERLVGLYGNYDRTLIIKIINNELVINPRAENRELKPHNDFAFSTLPGQGIIFQINNKGKPISCIQYHPSLGMITHKFLGKPKVNFSPAKEDWKKYVGLYYYKYYYTEYYFIPVTIDEQGYLQIENEKLYPHDTHPNIFFTELGTTVVFNKGSFYYNNILYTLLDSPVDFYENLIKTEPSHRALINWTIASVISSLKILNRNAEVEQIEALKKKKVQKPKF